MFARLPILFLFLAVTAWAETNLVVSTRQSLETTNSPRGELQGESRPGASLVQRMADLRADCIQNRRIICGKILQVLPDGLVIDSGYTNLMRAPVGRSWLVSGSVEARRAVNMVEGHQPDSVCLGLVFLVDPPRKPVAKVYDYVNLVGYPCGQYIYTSVGDLHRTVRKFSAKVTYAVHRRLEATEKQTAPLK